MKKIEEYIEQAQNMENVSDGGSLAYSFEDCVLIKYSISNKYGIARYGEERVAVEANKKNSKGVRTPAHLAVKRIEEEKRNICWVLQEKAKGVSFTRYSSHNNDAQTQLQYQQELIDAPDSHYEQCIRDLRKLFHMGLELKPKNIFYDKNKEKEVKK